MMRSARLLAFLSLLLAPEIGSAQGVSLQASRLLDGDGLASYQVSWTTSLLGPVGADLGGVLWRGPGLTENRLGLNADFSLFRGGRELLMRLIDLRGPMTTTRELDRAR